MRSTVTIATEPHACIEIEKHATFFSRSTEKVSGMDRGRVHPTRTRTRTRNEHVAQCVGHTPVNRPTEVYSIDL